MCGKAFFAYILLITITNRPVHSQKKNGTSWAQKECANYDFMGMIPFRTITTMIQDALKSDSETADLGAFLQSEKFSKLVRGLSNAIAFKQLQHFVNGIGVNVGNVIDRVGEKLQLWPTIVPTRVSRGTEEGGGGGDGAVTILTKPRGIRSLAKNIIEILPADKILRCLNLRVTADPIFKAVVDGIASPEFQNLIDHVRETDEYKSLQTSLEEKGLELNSIVTQILNFLRVPPS